MTQTDTRNYLDNSGKSTTDSSGSKSGSGQSTEPFDSNGDGPKSDGDGEAGSGETTQGEPKRIIAAQIS
jgi:hypothetical protein